MGTLKSLIAFILLLYLHSVWAVVDYTERKEPKGKLKVAIDWGLAQLKNKLDPENLDRPLRASEANLMLSTHLVFDDDIKVTEKYTPSQLWKIARDARDEVKVEMENYGWSVKANNRPLAMSILAFNNEIILASSQKGHSFTYRAAGHAHTKVWKDLQLCLATAQKDSPVGTNVQPVHTNMGSCGEEMTAHLYYLLHPHGPNLRDMHASMGTWVSAKNNRDLENPHKEPPCGDSKGSWGCNYFTGSREGGQNFNMLEIDNNDEKETTYDLEGLNKTQHVELCGSIVDWDDPKTWKPIGSK